MAKGKMFYSIVAVLLAFLYIVSTALGYEIVFFALGFIPVNWVVYKLVS